MTLTERPVPAPPNPDGSYAAPSAEDTYVAALGWNVSDELFVCTDGRAIFKWEANGSCSQVSGLHEHEYVTSTCSCGGSSWFTVVQVPFAGTPGVPPGLLEVHCTDMHWIPSPSKLMQQGSDVFAVGCTDGKF